MGKGVIILGHGSRREEANQEIKQMTDMLQTDDQGIIYQVAFLAFGQPDLPEAAGILKHRGVEAITVVPVFLVTGNHIMQDIPEEIAALKLHYPDIEFTMARHFGPDPGIVNIIKDRIKEANQSIT